MKVAVVYNQPVKGKPDSEDVLEEVSLVIDAIKTLGYDFRAFSIYNEGPSPHLSEVVFTLLNEVNEYSPSVIFNLVEGVGDRQRFYPVIASLFELSNYHYTGSPFDALLKTTDKVLTKALLNAHNIPTPLWVQYRGDKVLVNQSSDIRKNTPNLLFQNNDFPIAVPSPWIIKPAWEDASVGIDDGSVFNDKEMLMPKISKMHIRYKGQPILIEEYIDGREFNVSLFEHLDGTVEVLPVAETLFTKWPEGKPKIVGYKAKWDRDSFEYNNTVRRFNPEDAPLDLIRDSALKCWVVFGLRGYARVDMRMDKDGKIFVIEVNANPCIAPESGFITAVKEASYKIQDVVKEIINVSYSYTSP